MFAPSIEYLNTMKLEDLFNECHVDILPNDTVQIFVHLKKYNSYKIRTNKVNDKIYIIER